ncbi:tape measure protein [Ligilactobacillus equi]|uniref:Tape measure protein N-terminal domain-containing protein n=1 Tax=Ligilactobacillus equi DPC 6820 TaxID=1392007 RepID=V7HYY2_9LACO|nr:tape measure protein [Ligilactobacillus equi]ETA75097.1 hypothetical protein LEQ_1155 [Ligilactobacillus equi DPC 6820]
MADGSINIDINIPVSKAISDIDDLQKSISKLTDKDIEVKVSQAQAEEKVNDLVQMLSKVPENKRVQLYARAEKAGINSFSELLSALPKEKQTELLAKVEKNQAINWKSYLDELPKEKRTELTAKAEKGEVIDFKKLVDEVPKKEETKLEANTKSAKENINDLSKEVSNIKGKFSSLKEIMLGTFAGNMITNGINAITSSLKGAWEMGMRFNEEQDTMRTVWKSLTTEAPQDGKELVNYINQTAQSSIYAADTINEMAQSMYHVHSNVDETKKWTNSFVALGSTLHLTNDQLSESAEMFSKIMAGGNATAEDINVMINRFPMFGEELQKVTGKSMQEIRKMTASGKLSADTISETLEALGDKYKQGTEEGMTSFMGMGMFIKARSSQLLGEVTQSTFELSKKTRDSITSLLSNDAMDGYAKSISNAISGALTYITKFFSYISNNKWLLDGIFLQLVQLGKVIGGAVWQTFKGVVEGIVDAFGGFKKNDSSPLLQKLLDVLTKLTDHKEEVAKLASNATKVFLAFVAWKKTTQTILGVKKAVEQTSEAIRSIKKATSVLISLAKLSFSSVIASLKSFGAALRPIIALMIGNPIGLTITAIVALGTAFVLAYKYIKPFRDAVNKTWDAIKKLGKDIVVLLEPGFKKVGKLFKDLQKTFEDGMKGLYKLWKVGWDAIVDIVSAITKPLRKVVTKLLDSVGDWISDKWSDIKKNTSKSWENIKDTISDRLEETKSSSTKLAGHIASAVADKWDELHSNSSKIWGNISSTIVRLVQGLKRSLDGIFSSISSAWSNLWSGLGSIFTSIWSGVKGAVRDGMNAVIDFINGGINGVNSVISFFGGKKNTIGTIKKLATGTSAVNERQLAVVNDEKATDYREAIFRANGQVEIPEGRDVLTVLNPGDSVMPAQATKAMFPHYANGVGDWLSAAWNNVKDWAGDTYEAIKGAIANPLGTLQSIFNKSTNNTSGVYRSIADGAGSYLPKVGADWFKKQLEKLKEALSIENVSGDANAWIPVIKQVADRMNVELTSGGLSAILRRINQESGGSATVTNNWDSNAKAGHPSKGLLQYIQPTLSAWAATSRGFGANLSSGADQLAAMFNDSNWLRDISVSGGWGPTGHRRYANGGWANQASIFGEDGLEVAINPSKQTADSLILQAIRARAIADPKGMSAKLNALVERAKIGQISSFRAVQPNIDDSPSQVAKGLNTENNSVSGNVKLNIQLDSKIIAKATYPLQKAMEAREITILQNGGAIY